ncbi:MAG: hypothetical protein C4524_07815 [Candidatus Zixiibacteriota bacterium]|nr:MAG: hypothetical protein C4524_07815 [candidate division Zixibacteria bacterium]
MKSDLVKAFIAALESDDPHRAGEYLSDDFTFQGPIPGPLNKAEFLDYFSALKKGLPDFAFNLDTIREEEGILFGVLHRTGTHTGELALPGIVPILPTGMSVALPNEPIHFHFCGNQICELEIDHASGGGLEGILEQLGAEMPQNWNWHQEPVPSI